jgi:hypothetical protein
MRRSIYALTTAITAALGLSAMQAVATAHAQPAPRHHNHVIPATSWTAQCDQQSPRLCMYANGTSGDYVYGKLFSQGTNAEGMAIYAVNGPCSNGNNLVQDGADGDDNCDGVAYWWPFTNHHLDDLYGNLASGEVVTLRNVHSGLCYLRTDVNGVVQGDCSLSGHLWVWWPLVKPSPWLFINVSASDDAAAGLPLCANGQDNPLIVGCPNDDNGNREHWSAKSS